MSFLGFYTLILLASYSLCFAVIDLDSSQPKRHEAATENYPRPAAPSPLNGSGPALKTATECPPDQSLLSKKDIISMINYLESQLNISYDIMRAHFPRAIAVRDKHVSSLKDIQTKLETRPEHFKHILEDIDRAQMLFKPIVDAFVSKLQEYDTYKDKFLNVNERAQKVLETLDKYTQLCKLNSCDEPQFMMRQSDNSHVEIIIEMVTDHDYYCTSLMDLHERLRLNLTDFQNAYHNDMAGRIHGDDVMYAAVIDNIKNKLKETGVSLFDTTMYDILSLQEEYHHYADFLDGKSDIAIEFKTIRKNTLDAEVMLIELEEGVETYHQYCLNCKAVDRSHNALLRNPFNNWPNQPPKMMETHTKIESLPNTEELINTMNVHDLITAKMDGIKKVIENYYTSIFIGLDKVLNDPNLINAYIEKLKPVKLFVRNELVVRQNALINLENKVSQSMVDQVYELSEESMQLLDIVKSATDFVNKYV